MVYSKLLTVNKTIKDQKKHHNLITNRESLWRGESLNTHFIKYSQNIAQINRKLEIGGVFNTKIC